MKKEGIYKVTIYNEDRTPVYFAASNKHVAFEKYCKWVDEHFDKGYIDKDVDFDIEYEDDIYV